MQQKALRQTRQFELTVSINAVETGMKTIDQWLEEYGESHRNKTNKLIHWVCRSEEHTSEPPVTL